MKYLIYTKINPVRVEVKEYNSKEELLDKLYYEVRPQRFGRPDDNIDIEYIIKTKYGISWNNEELDFKPSIVVDKLGRKIPPYILCQWLENYEPSSNKKRRWQTRWRSMWNNWLGFRNGPVPYTGKGNWGKGSGPKINSEMRASQDTLFTRAKRSFRKLYSERESHKRYFSRGWKNNKKRKQWM
jgi:hypothetical protein